MLHFIKVRLKQPSETEVTELHYNLENSTCDPLKYTMDNPILTVSICMENPSEYKGLNRKSLCKYQSYLSVTRAFWERSGSMVECLTRDRRATGSSLTGVTALWSLSQTHLS